VQDLLGRVSPSKVNDCSRSARAQTNKQSTERGERGLVNEAGRAQGENGRRLNPFDSLTCEHRRRHCPDEAVDFPHVDSLRPRPGGIPPSLSRIVPLPGETGDPSPQLPKHGTATVLARGPPALAVAVVENNSEDVLLSSERSVIDRITAAANESVRETCALVPISNRGLKGTTACPPPRRRRSRSIRRPTVPLCSLALARVDPANAL